MFKLIRNRKIWYLVSALMLAAGIFGLVVFKLKLGIDYTGGTIIVYQGNQSNLLSVVEESVKSQNVENLQIKKTGDNEVTVKMPPIDNQTHAKITESIKSKASDTTEIKYDVIGPTIGKDLTNKSILAVIFASIGIILYIAYSFRKVPKPLSSWKFGVLAVVALIHDLIITAGIVAIIGHFYSWMEVDSLFITALLTIMGFSVHDTIVVYDRLRENYIKNPHQDIEITTEESVNQTLARSINTSLTTIIVLLALALFGGAPIRHFVITLMIGITVGTYSSIFVASPLVVSWHKKK